MWCADCCQDVPGVVSPDDSTTVVCARCQRPLGRPLSHKPTCAASSNLPSRPEAPSVPGSEPDNELPGHDDSHVAMPLADFTSEIADWQLDDDLDRAKRLVHEHRALRQPSAASAMQWRIDAPHGQNTAATSPGDERSSIQVTASQTTPAATSPSTGKASYLAWSLIAAGMITFIGSATLLGWSFASEQARWWKLATTMLVAGQTALLSGLTMQLQQLTHTCRQLQDELHSLRRQLENSSPVAAGQSVSARR